jgi:hypothetical protein
VHLMGEGGLVFFGPLLGHVSCYFAGPEAADGEDLHLNFLLKLLLLSLRECDNLLDIN